MQGESKGCVSVYLSVCVSVSICDFLCVQVVMYKQMDWGA